MGADSQALRAVLQDATAAAATPAEPVGRLRPASVHRRLWLLARPQDLAPLAPLLAAWRARGIVVEHRPYAHSPPDVSAAVRASRSGEAPHAAPDAVLLVAPPRRAPNTLLEGPFASDATGRRIPVACLPATSADALARFAEAAAQVQRRQGEGAAAPGDATAGQARPRAISRARQTPLTVALLAQWQPAYLRVTERLHRSLNLPPPAGAEGGAATQALRWSGERLGRDGLMAALACGIGLAVYMGHGRPVGWVGYHGVRAHHFLHFTPGGPGLDPGTQAPGTGQDPQTRARPPGRPRPARRQPRAPEPMGALLSLCCRTASRRRCGLSYAESLPLLGVAAASFGAVNDTLHTDNTRWAVGVSQALRQGADNVGELLVKAAPRSPSAWRAYRLIGDPMAPLHSTARSLARARLVETHP